ncbi:hypothetical protein GE107_17615 [Cohnella sp. CFH 77786]|uniref:hypothetical protein n=1 Tax=Cohnella sp. CFH 77786 TaxID=2662265 RepID=UPI001C60AA24|nr:hypothetical protein [Cohnella sp. CFH 77786]MBW5447875.1 hypothetical protein [Cohnella sp. CFH 77786]
MKEDAVNWVIPVKIQPFDLYRSLVSTPSWRERNVTYDNIRVENFELGQLFDHPALDVNEFVRNVSFRSE